MILASSGTIEDRLVHLLATIGSCSAVSLHEQYAKTHRSISKQAVYKVLRNLQSCEVVYKHNGNYHLNMGWLLNFIDLALKAQNTYFGSEFLKQILEPNRSNECSWRFESIESLCQRYSQLLILLTKTSKTKILYQYHPHAWLFYMCNNAWHAPHNRYRNTLKRNGIILGCEGYIEKALFQKNLRNNSVGQIYIADESEKICTSQQNYTHIIDDFVLQIVFDEYTSDITSRLCGQISTKEDMELIDTLFRRKAKIKITLKRDERASKILRERFERVFGPITIQEQL